MIIGKDLELKSSTVERAVIELINKFLDVITDPNLQEGKYEWMDPTEAIKPVGSLSRLQGVDELGVYSFQWNLSIISEVK